MPLFSHKATPLLILLIDGLLMAVIMSGALSAINFGIDEFFLERWVRSFLIAFPVALLASSLVVPLGRKLVALITERNL